MRVTERLNAMQEIADTTDDKILTDKEKVKLLQKHITTLKSQI